MKSNKRVLMLAYAQYYNDARIKMYVNTLLENGIPVDIVCLYDEYSRSTVIGNVPLTVTFVQNKYQGESAFRYLISYCAFFLKAWFLVTINYMRNSYSVIHVHNQPDFLVFCALIPKLFGATIILDMHDIMIAAVLTKFSGTKKSLLYRLTKFQTWVSVKVCDILICADHSQREFLSENHIVHYHTVVMMNLPDKALFRRRNAVPKNPVIRFIYHGTISHRLGLDLAILAFEKASHSIPLTFTIIGNGENKKELMRSCEENGILHSLVEFHDFVPVEELQRVVERYDIGIVANRRTLIGERCMLPVKMMEYLAIGLPVVVPRLQVIERYFSDTMVSFYEPENIDDMAKRIIELAEDSSLRQRQVHNAGEFFKKYAWADQQHEYVRIINGI